MRTLLKSKISQAEVTNCNLLYEGSITIDKELMKKADLVNYEQVQVVNINNGKRFITYAIEGCPFEICLNGAAARLGCKGDFLIIMAYDQVPEDKLKGYFPKIVHARDNY